MVEFSEFTLQTIRILISTAVNKDALIEKMESKLHVGFISNIIGRHINDKDIREIQEHLDELATINYHQLSDIGNELIAARQVDPVYQLRWSDLATIIQRQADLVKEMSAHLSPDRKATSKAMEQLKDLSGKEKVALSLISTSPVNPARSPHEERLLNSLMKKYGFTPETVFYRRMHPQYIASSINDTYFITGYYQMANDTLLDEYIEPAIDTTTRQLKDPGIAVTTRPTSAYKGSGPLTIAIRLKDVLDEGGLIYKNTSAHAYDSDITAWHLTVPLGRLIPVRLYESNPFLAELGVIYNRVLNRLVAETDLNDFAHQPDGFCTAEFIQYRPGAPQRISTGKLNARYHIENEGLIIKLEHSQGVDIPQALNSIALMILMSHPHISRLQLPNMACMPTPEFLAKLSA